MRHPTRRATRRQVLAGAAGIAAAHIVLRRPAQAQGLPPHEQALYEAARREGEVTWYSGQVSADTSEAVGRAFAERYQGMKVNVVTSTSQVAFQRVSQDLRANVAQCDVLSSTNTGHFRLLKRNSQLMQFRPRNADGLLPSMRIADPDNFYQTTNLALSLLAYNTTKLREADAPRTWQDVLDAKWRNQLAVGHPGFSGAIGVWVVQMRKMFGWDYFRRLERNRPQIGRSAADPITVLNAGERAIAVAAPSATTLRSIARGNPLKLVYPTDGVIGSSSPSAIIRNAPHPNAARLFMEYATGPQFNDLMRRSFHIPLRPEVEQPQGAMSLEGVPILSPTPEEAEKEIPEIRELWRDTFGV
ncbi:MAG: extracellular solute-binding protein [Alphaproteobacteria bacterium]|nr:extracellular solute-binding protein [Alphaproteobacteria bacterium]